MRTIKLREYTVYEQVSGLFEGRVVPRGTVTAPNCTDALRIAKQKGFIAPLIGDKK